MGQRGNLRALAEKCEFHKSYFNWSFETSSSRLATTSEQTVQNIVMATVEYWTRPF